MLLWKELAAHAEGLLEIDRASQVNIISPIVWLPQGQGLRKIEWSLKD